jgi:glucokinase
VDVLGIDVGGTTVKASRVAVDGTVLATQSVATPDDSASLTAAVVALASSLRDASTAAVGVACPGVVDGGTATYAVNLPWRNEPVAEQVARALGLPVFLIHDVGAGGLAESAQVSGDDVLFVAIGTGIACAHVVTGVVRRGATGRAGEMGHSPVHPDGDACACGQRGCLEVYASAAAIARRYTARTGIVLSTVEIAARLDTDPDAAAVWHDAVDALALALATDVLVRDPAVIVLGGGLAEAGDVLFAPVRAALAGRLAWRAAPPIVGATLGAAAGQIGAAQHAWRELGAMAPRQQESAS